MDRVVAYLAEQRGALAEGSRLIASGDRAGVHDSRVAVRRARSVLRTFRSCFEDVARRQLDAALVLHARRLGGVRDLEVLLEVLDRQFADVEDPTPGGLRGWILERLRAELDTGWLEVCAAVAAEDPDELPARFETVLASAVHLDKRSVAKLARRADRRARRMLARAGGDPERLHEARKAAKRARYAAEAIGDGATAAQQKRVQDVLGHHHDLVVAARWIAAAAVLPAVRADARRLAVRLETQATAWLARLP